MKLTPLKEVESKLLNRKRIVYEVLFPDKTPSKEDLKQSIAAGLKIDSKLIRIRHLYQRFGQKKSKAIVHIYKKEEDLKKTEEKAKKKKNGKEKETKKQSS
jgi:ribosomal protein S24E